MSNPTSPTAPAPGVPLTDAFALFSEIRRPWPDLELLKSKFLARSAEVHPDRVHSASEAERTAANGHYAELNAAYNRLREPKDRLIHLYELEAGEPPRDIQRIPPGTMDLFVEVGQLCRDCDAFIEGRTLSSSPMLKLKSFQEGLDWTERLLALQQRVNARRDNLITELMAMNSIWESAPPPNVASRLDSLPLDRLEQIYRTMSYIARWTEQIQERVVRLAV